MNKNNIVFIGLDTHKEFIEVAYIEDGFQGQPYHLGRISSAKTSIKKMVRQFESKYPHATLHFVYEAGPCGYWIYRLLTSLGQSCYVVAPSLIPKKTGDRVKIDKRDAFKLAQSLKNADVSPIYVPEPEDEAVRDLNDARYQLKALLLRNNRLERLDNELSHHVQQWCYYPVVKALQAMRGVRLLVAAGIVAEMGDMTRFDHPRKLMSFLGLTPSEHSSGGKRWLGSITKCGNTRARR